MKPTSHAFRDKAASALDDAKLQTALGILKERFVTKRATAVAQLPEFEAMRQAAADIKDHTLAHLDHYLERFADKVAALGGQVHFCATAADARQTVVDICRQAGARTATKSKSMVTEEIALNEALEAAGVTPVETDLGEYIIQLNRETPSHIIAPAVHKSRQEVADIFAEHHAGLGQHGPREDIADLVAEARTVLRQRYFAADVGITGANVLIAETGQAVLVTNEGNADLTHTLPRVHIAVTGIEKLVPTLEDATALLRVLGRSATGQAMSTYTTLFAGPRRPGDTDGPDAFHVVLVDNGRSALLAPETRALMRCIRCGACMNHCPVYAGIGGHAYGWVYPGPVGAALNPAMIGLDEARHLPTASTLCGACAAVCPVKIPLPDLFRHWRDQAFARRLTPVGERWGLTLWAFLAQRPWAYRRVVRLASGLLRWLAGRRGRLTRLPLAGGWTRERDLPTPPARSFMDQWRRR